MDIICKEGSLTAIDGPKDHLVFASTHKENQEVHSG